MLVYYIVFSQIKFSSYQIKFTWISFFIQNTTSFNQRIRFRSVVVVVYPLLSSVETEEIQAIISMVYADI